MKKKSPEEKMAELVRSIRLSFSHWKGIKRKGTTDPSWPDGTNMNLVRNHIIYDQRQLKELCKGKCPKEAKLKLPKKVSENYMAPRSKAMKMFRKSK